jgi:hypothetical protein
LIERGHCFERQANELPHRAVEIVEKTLALSWEKKERRQEEGKHS